MKQTNKTLVWSIPQWNFVFINEDVLGIFSLHSKLMTSRK